MSVMHITNISHYGYKAGHQQDQSDELFFFFFAPAIKQNLLFTMWHFCQNPEENADFQQNVYKLQSDDWEMLHIAYKFG